MTRKVRVHYSELEAQDFFERLEAYSAEYVRHAIPGIYRHWPSGNFYDDWNADDPIGNVLHYTAGTKFAGTIRHFVLGNRASSNWVLAKALDRRFEEARKNLELDADLRAEVVQVVHPRHPSWHAAWVNRLCTGLEFRNAGILRAHPAEKSPGQRSMTPEAFFEYGNSRFEVEDLKFYWWPNGWTEEFGGEVVAVGDSWWESWSRGMIATAIAILRYLVALAPDKIDPVYFLAHHQTSARKNDIALPIDLDLFREAVLFSKEHVDDLEWLAEYDDVEDGFEDVDDPWMIRESDERAYDRADEDLDGFDPKTVLDRGREISGSVDRLAEGIEALRRLGYLVDVDENARRSARIFQRSRGLEVDGIVGSQTLAALDREMRRWRIGGAR